MWQKLCPWPAKPTQLCSYGLKTIRTKLTEFGRLGSILPRLSRHYCPLANGKSKAAHSDAQLSASLSNA
jgi:hypothetical protein